MVMKTSAWPEQRRQHAASTKEPPENRGIRTFTGFHAAILQTRNNQAESGNHSCCQTAGNDRAGRQFLTPDFGRWWAR